MRAGRRRWVPIAVVTALLVLAALSRAWWLPYIGTMLSDTGVPRKAEVAVVLSGDYFGNRILKAGELVRDGLVPAALVSGPSGMYGLHDSDLSIPFAARHGFPESMFIAVPNDARSTREEAALFVPELRRRGVKRLLLVTSDYHTRRARRLFRAAAPELDIIAVGAPDADFRLERWWTTREGRKYVVTEWAKTIGERLGL